MAFAREGADVVVNYLRSKDEAEEVVGEITSLGRKAMAIKADVSDLEDVGRMVKITLQEYGRIDTLVNNAADFSVMEF